MDAKSKFQEVAQERFGLTPNYRVMQESGPDHDKVFMVGVYVGDKRFGQGSGSSKQAAQQEAAAHALTSLPESRSASSEQ
jgi:ribonuclease-3